MSAIWFVLGFILGLFISYVYCRSTEPKPEDIADELVKRGIVKPRNPNRAE